MKQTLGSRTFDAAMHDGDKESVYLVTTRGTVAYLHNKPVNENDTIMTELHTAINERRTSEVIELLKTDGGKAMAKESDEGGDLPLHQACALGIEY